MNGKLLSVGAALLLISSVAYAEVTPSELHGHKVPNLAKSVLEHRINSKLLAEARKNQCVFKTDTDSLAPGCDAKMKHLASTIIEAKKELSESGITAYKFEVSAHTESGRNATWSKELSERRADVIVKELVERGVPRDEIIATGMGGEQPLVSPDDTPAKKAKNRRYELRLRMK